MSEPTSRYRSNSQIIADEFRNIVFVDESQSQLQSIEQEKFSFKKHHDHIKKLKDWIDHLKKEDIVPVSSSEIKLNGNVTRKSKLYIFSKSSIEWNLIIIFIIIHFLVCSINSKVGVIYRRSNALSIFFQFCPQLVFELIAVYTNRHLMFNGSKSSTTKYHKTNWLEIIHFFRVRLCILLFKSNSKKNISDYYNDNNLRRDDWLPLSRFKLLHGKSGCDLNKLTNQLRTCSMNLFYPSQIFSIDELLISFKSRRSKLIVNYPRKPHPIGYLVFVMSAKSERCQLPIAYDFSPIIKSNQTKDFMFK